VGRPTVVAMSAHAETARRYWQCAEARDWDGFAALLAPDVVYEMAQTRERVRGRDAYLRFNQGYPGDWHLAITQLVGDDDGAATLVAFSIGDEAMTGITFFTFDDDGRVLTVRDFWPEAYDPPPGREHLVERY
jgi:ketosteroid isomerase-like protein